MNSAMSAFRGLSFVGVFSCALCAHADVPTRVWDFEGGTIGQTAGSVACSTGVADEQLVRGGTKSTIVWTNDVPFDSCGGVANTCAACVKTPANEYAYALANAKANLGIDGSPFTFEAFAKIDYAPRWATFVNIPAANSKYSLVVQANSDGDSENHFRINVCCVL